MIDIEKAKKEFKKYIKNYDITNPKIKLKTEHIERVANIAKEIARNLNLSSEDVELAELIGFLHDIGRFEQVKRYNTFTDKLSVNHGELGTEILFKDGKIRDFIEDNKYDEIIKKSILNHNRDVKDIEFSNEKEEMFSKIIRDADKTDILYVMTFEDKDAVWGKADFHKETITDEIYIEFLEDKHIDYKERKTAADKLVGHFSFIYDFNYIYGLKIIKDGNYIEKIYNRFEFDDEETKNRFNKIYKISKQYLENI